MESHVEQRPGHSRHAEETGHSSPSERKLRVGVIVHSVELYAWECALIERLKDSPDAEIAVVVIARPLGCRGAPAPVPDTEGRPRHLIERANDLLETRRTVEHDAFARKDCVPLLSAIRTTRAAPRLEGHEYRWTDADLARLAAYDLDVFVCLPAPAIGAGLVSIARHGVWFLSHGDERSGFGDPPGFWEVYHGCPVTTSSVHILSEHYEWPTVACRSFSATDMTSVRRTNNTQYWKAASLLPHKLEELRRTGADTFFRRVDADVSNIRGPTNALHEPPTHADLTRHVAKICRRGLRNKIDYKLFLPQWLLLYHRGAELSTHMQDFQEIVPPKDCFWADPHVVLRDGRHYVFFEELPFATNKGHICVMEIDGQGRCGAPVKVLERPYHLSYPLIYEHDGQTLMIPETADNRTIEVYRCTAFPHGWELAGTLMEDVCAVDTTLLNRDGKWWLFANMVDTEGGSSWDELFLFYSDSLLEGPWTPHPLNPIVSDVRRARPAGPIYEKNGKLYRPSQDCSVRYGYGIRINQITKLTTDDYMEIEVESIWPNWDKSIIATHMLSHAPGLTVADALRPRRRF